MSRRRRNSRTRRLGDSGTENEAERETKSFWHGVNGMPDSPAKIQVTEQPASVIRSLGSAPLTGQETVTEHYFEAVYQRSVALASALAASAEMLGDDEDEQKG
ncbi:MAG: hypothetical protein CL434_12900 [Acidimicrobiaceae bacterium]|jgi:hypothetical protein|nr:hypothetical protein [Acidimicrobiaceae bacterium]|tara:strand:- start:763 stop:1071 length:309 start_codon:yes stop_codon:yes gene_type:complete